MAWLTLVFVLSWRHRIICRKAVKASLLFIQNGHVSLTLTSITIEVEEDKKLHGQHAIDEAMSTLSYLFLALLGVESCFCSSRSHEELPKMPQR